MKKKYLAMLALFIGGLLISTAMAFGVLFILLIMYPFGIFLSVFMLCGLMAGIWQLRRVCEDRFQLKTGTFVVLAEVPSFVASAIVFGIVYYLDYTGYWYGDFFGGLVEFFSSLSWLVGSAFILLGTGVICLFSYCQRKVKAKTEPDGGGNGL